MNPACDELQVLITLRADGALDPVEAAAVEAHLRACPACREEAARDAELLGLARLPPPTAREAALVAEVPGRVVAEVRRGRGRHRAVARAVGVVAAIAAAALLVAVPGLLRRGAGPGAGGEEVAALWQEPDLEAIWNETDILEIDPAAQDPEQVPDVSRAAYAADEAE